MTININLNFKDSVLDDIYKNLKYNLDSLLQYYNGSYTNSIDDIKYNLQKFQFLGTTEEELFLITEKSSRILITKIVGSYISEVLSSFLCKPNSKELLNDIISMFKTKSLFFLKVKDDYENKLNNILLNFEVEVKPEEYNDFLGSMAALNNRAKKEKNINE